MSFPLVEDHLHGLDAPTGAEPDFDRRTLEGVRSYLQAHAEHIVSLHRAGRGGVAVNEANSDGIDRLIRRLVRAAESIYYAGGGEPGESVSVVAVGGYARREMAIHSDVDLLFLHGSPLTPLASTVAERIQYWLWDAGLKVGGAVRGVPETIKLGKRDETVGTNILDARFLGGETSFYQQLIAAVQADMLRDPVRFVRTQIAAMEARRERYGASSYLLQPNLKEGAGGLRDYHSAYWIARASVPNMRGVSDLLHRGLLTESEMAAYLNALSFLWNVRNELHLMEGRGVDQMSFEHQERIADTLGYEDLGPGELPVERFMRDYYRHARAIRNFSQASIEECRRRIEPKLTRRRGKMTEEGFQLIGDRLEIPYAARVRERPLRLLLAFAAAQEFGATISRSALRVIREHLDLVDDGFRKSEEAAEIFDRILASRSRVASTLMAMNECGLLAAYLPEWEQIVCRWQHVIYHTYTVDVHSIFLVEELQRLWLGEYQEIAPDLTSLVQHLEDLPVVLWGCLLHDIGKGLGGDHSDRGAHLAGQCLGRLGVGRERLDRAVFLVEKHLLMSKIAQRRDLSDPKVIVEFAKAVVDRENLRNLYLVTFADIRASSTGAWTEWKGRLIRELYERTSEYLEAGGDDPDIALEQIEAESAARREVARRALEEEGHDAPQIEGYFESMPRRYFLTHSPTQIARHAAVVLSFDGSERVRTAVREFAGGYSELILCTPDVHGLYSKVAGTLTAVDINILGSHVYTTRDNLALEVYRMTTPEGGADERRFRWREFEDQLERVLSGDASLTELLRTRRRRIGFTPSPARGEASVVVSNRDSDFYTVIDVTTNDRPGLLYDLTRTLADRGLEVYISKASTVLDQVADTFYVRDADGHQVSGEKDRNELCEALLAVARSEELVG